MSFLPIKCRFKAYPLIAAVVFILRISTSIGLFAEDNDIALSGRIISTSGSGVANAHVSVMSAKGAELRSIVSNDKGLYTLPYLAPGEFEIKVSANGFADAALRVTITPEFKEIPNITMLPAGAIAAKDAENMLSKAESVSESMDSKTLSELPLNGRSATDIAALEPGVLKARTQSTGGVKGYGSQMAIFGGRPRQNSSRLDGISVNDYANGPLGNAIGVSLGVDAMEQMSVLTRNDQAQYGRSSGGYINSSTRAGTNSFHGSAFQYIRNSALDARSFFDIIKRPFRRYQFGASASGPVWRDRIYLFGNYEGIRQSKGNTQVAVVPSEAARRGDLSTGHVSVDTEIQRVLQAFYPLPNAGLLGAGNTGVYVSSGQTVAPGNHAAGRIDYKISRADALYGSYAYDAGSKTGPDKLSNKLSTNDSNYQFFSLNENHAFNPSLINSFRFGIYRMVTNNGATRLLNNPLEADTSYGAVPGRTVPWIKVPGLVRLAGGLGGMDVSHFRWTSIQAMEDIAFSWRTHSVKLGLFIERDRNNVLAVSEPNGAFYFNSLSDFLTNRPFSFSVALPGAIHERGFRQTVMGGYFQDDWLIRPNLTIALGLRYEMATVPAEVHNQLTTLRSLTDGQPHLGSPLFSNPTLHNFEPRVGIAWDPLHEGNIIVNAGFGIFDVLPLLYQIEYSELFSAPFFQSVSVANLPPGSYPTGAYTIAAASKAGFAQAYFEPNPHRNYVMHWNLTTQWRLPMGIDMKLGHVGSRGVHHIFRVKDANIVLPIKTAEGYLWPSPAANSVVLNPNAGRITAAFWEGDSYYNALVLQIRKMIQRSFQITGSYTWGKSIDTGSGSIEGDEYSNAISSPLWFDTRINRGQSDYDIAHNLRIIFSWQIDGPKSSWKPASWSLSGWQVGGVLKASTGVPFTPGFGGDPLGVKSSDTNIDVPNVLVGPGCESLVNSGNFVHYIKTECFAVPSPINLRGNLGRNRLVGPGLMTVDFSVFKNNHIKSISDTFNVQFRAEFFNLFNRPNILSPLYNRAIFDTVGNSIANGGMADATSTSSRNIQFALRVLW